MVVDDRETELSRLFRALSDATRRDILRRTLRGPVSVSGLAAAYAMSFAAVQKHVAVLEEAGLVVKVAVGRERMVRADPRRISVARACLDELELLWRHRLSGLDDVLFEPEPVPFKPPSSEPPSSEPPSSKPAPSKRASSKTVPFKLKE